MSNWPMVRVGDIAVQVRGVSYEKQDASGTPRPDYLPILRAGNITNDGLVFDDLVYVPAFRISAQQRVRKNDVIVAASSGSLDVVGKAARSISDFDGGFGAFCKALRLHKAGVDPAYFAHFFRTSVYRRRVSALAAGANINNLRSEHLDDLEMPLPPFDEQRRVAAILDEADALRSKRRSAVARVEMTLAALFLDAFGHPVANPHGWRQAPLMKLGTVKTGGTPPGGVDGMFGGTVPFVTPGDLESDKEVKRTVTEAGAAAAETVRAGATLVCCIGATIGKIDKVAQRSAFNQQINAVEWTESIVDEYGFQALRMLKPVIVARGASTTLPILKKSAFERMEIPVPPIDLQRAFAARVTVIERLKAAHRASLAKLDELFASLQYRAFRGEL